MKNTFYYYLIARVGMVVFWLLLLAGIVFIPWHRFFPQKKEITVLTWAGIFEERVLKDFTKQTGIEVNITHYTSNEELIVLLRATRGKGYDVLVPSDYAVNILREHNLLKKIDKSRCSFIGDIEPLLLHYHADPSNEYSLPYTWEIYGLGYDKDFFGEQLKGPSWRWIFNKPGYCITMLNDPIEVVNMAAFYLYSSLPQLDVQQQREVAELLIKQREWVKAYTSFRPDYFLVTHNCPLVVSPWSSILRGMSQADNIGFAIPIEGPFISIESLALSRATTHDEMVYQFLNFVYQYHVMRYLFEVESVLPARRDVLRDIPLNHDIEWLVHLDRASFEKKVHFYKHVVPEEVLYRMWVDIKSR